MLVRIIISVIALFPYLRTNFTAVDGKCIMTGKELMLVSIALNTLYTVENMFDLLSGGWERSNGRRELIKPTITFISDVIVANISITEPSTEFPVDVTIDISNLTDKQIYEF